MQVFTIREHEKIQRGEGPECIPDLFADRLVKAANSFAFPGHGDGGVLVDGRKELRARGVVGVIAAEGCCLEILPKIATGNEPNAQIRKRLVQMLSVVLDMKIATGSGAKMDWENSTLLEILVRNFCDRLAEAVRRGMPRKYVAQEGDLPVLRGSLDIARQFTRHTVNPGILACRFDELSPDIELNRIMKATLIHLSKLSRSLWNLQRIQELSFIYAEISVVAVNQIKWDHLVLDRTNRGWRELLQLAKLFLSNQFQTTSTGSLQGMSLLFDMNRLFEEYIGRLISRALAQTDYTVRLQGGGEYCLTVCEDNRKIFRTKPDILIQYNQQVTHVIDTKWKRISGQIDDKKRGISQSDVYQMMAYSQLYQAPRLTLLYPHYNDLHSEDGVHERFRIAGRNSILEAASIDVAHGSNDHVQKRLKQLILE